MAETFTSRLGLIKPARDTNTPLDVERLNLNSDAIDRAVGAYTVENGAIPPTPELYDGKIVRERVSGAIWIAEKQTNGSFTKKWVNYPYHYTAVSTAQTFQASGTWNLWGWNLYAAYGQLNSSHNDQQGGALPPNGPNFWRCPFTGLWRIQYIDLFFAPSGAQPAKGQYRGSIFTVDGVDENATTLTQHFYGLGYYNENTGNMANNCVVTRFINAGSIIGHRIKVDNAGQVDVHSSFYATAEVRMD